MFYLSTNLNTSLLSIHLARSDGSRWNNGGAHAQTQTQYKQMCTQTLHPCGRFKTSDMHNCIMGTQTHIATQTETYKYILTIAMYLGYLR